MKFISWNVNGLRACINKGWRDFFDREDADVFCIQETKMQEEQLELITPNHYQYWNSADKKGYSGTAIFTKKKPINAEKGLRLPRHDTEGRVITLEFDAYFIVTVYTPNAQDGLKRLDYRLDWEDSFREYLKELDRTKPVIICGDMNVAHQEIDLKNPKSNRGNPGFSDEEREKFTLLLSSGFTDSFRYLYPDLEGAYTWWSYRTFAREKDVGWRIDYFLVSDRLRDSIENAFIFKDVYGSDHCPVGLSLNLQSADK
jgi:exodeoxyribonuclease-3